MKYNLAINGETRSLSVEAQAEDRLVVTSDSGECQLECRRIDTHQLTLIVDGVQTNAYISGDAKAKEILINGVAYQVHDADRQAQAAASGRRAEEQPREVTPPMPSVVVKVLVEEGQHVARGDSLVVVSAMKMETTLTAPFDARVGRVNVAAGDKVMPGDILIDLEKVPEKAR